jgi:hypothetical protein
MVKKLWWDARKCEMTLNCVHCAANDRLCQQCYQKNEEQLMMLRRSDNAENAVNTTDSNKTTNKSTAKQNGKKLQHTAPELTDDAAMINFSTCN